MFGFGVICRKEFGFAEAVFKMSSDCGNCDCADKSQCTKKKGFQVDDIVETGCNMRFSEEVFGAVAMENDCKCGPNCKCTNCTCH